METIYVIILVVMIVSLIGNALQIAFLRPKEEFSQTPFGFDIGRLSSKFDSIQGRVSDLEAKTIAQQKTIIGLQEREEEHLQMIADQGELIAQQGRIIEEQAKTIQTLQNKVETLNLTNQRLTQSIKALNESIDY